MQKQATDVVTLRDSAWEENDNDVLDLYHDLLEEYYDLKKTHGEIDSQVEFARRHRGCPIAAIVADDNY